MILLYFYVKNENNLGQIKWATSSEINNDYFNIEKSTDGKVFETIGKKYGAGNSQQIINYSFNDFNLSQDLNYYRLKQIDFNGAFEYSPIVVIDKSSINQISENYKIYPNPVTQFLTIENISSKKSESHFEITDLTGKQWMSDKFTETKTIELNTLAPGLYVINIYNLNGEIVNREKIIVNR